MPNGEGIKIRIELEVFGKEVLDKIKADLDALERKVKELGGGFKATTEKIKETNTKLKETSEKGKDIEASFKNAVGRLEHLGNRFRYLSLVLTAVTGGLALLTKATLQTAQQFEQATLRLDAFAIATGQNVSEVEKAAREFVVANAGLISYSETAEALAHLMATGLNIDEARKVLQRYLDTAVLAKESISDTYGRAVVKAALGTRILTEKQVDAIGVNFVAREVWKEYAKTLGKTTEALSTQERQQAIINYVMEHTTQYAGAASLMTDTYSGAVARLNTSLQFLKETIGRAIIPAFGTFAEWAAKAVTKLAELIEKHPALTSAIMLGTVAATAFAGVLATMGALLPMVIVGLGGATVGLGALAVAFGKVFAIATVVSLALGGLLYLVLKMTGAWDRWRNSMERLRERMSRVITEMRTGMEEAASQEERVFQRVSVDFERIARDFSENVANMVRDQARAAEDASYAYDRLRAKFAEAMAEIERRGQERYEREKIRHQRTLEDLTERLEEERSKGLWADQTRIRDLEKRIKRENEDWNRFEKEHAERMEDERKRTEESFASQLLAIEKSLSKAGESLDKMKDQLRGLGVEAQNLGESFEASIPAMDRAKTAASAILGVLSGIAALGFARMIARWLAKLGVLAAMQFPSLTRLSLFISEIAATLASPFVLTITVVGAAAIGAVLYQVKQLKSEIDSVKSSVLNLYDLQDRWLRDLKIKLKEGLISFDEYERRARRILEEQKAMSKTLEGLQYRTIMPWSAEGRRVIKRWLGFQAGGIVPGPIGRPVPAIVHGGETILPAGTSTITININNPIVRESQDIRRLAEAVSNVLSQRQRWAKLGAF